MKYKSLILTTLLFPTIVQAEINSIGVVGSDDVFLGNAYQKSASQLASSLASKKKTIYCIETQKGLAGTFLNVLKNKKATYQSFTYKLPEQTETCLPHTICTKEKYTHVADIEDQMLNIISKGNALVILPGSFDVMYVFNYLEMLSTKKEITYKPVVFLNTNHFWDKLKDMLTEMKRQDIISDEVLDTIAFENKPDNVFKTIEKLEKQTIKLNNKKD